jgi:Xaa-Pro aminopeptidase
VSAVAETKDLTFPLDEYQRRLSAIQARIAEKNLDALVLFGPANLFYVTGYETIGYSNFQFAVVPASGEPRLLVRELESAPARRLSWMASPPVSYEDDEDPIQASAELIRQMGLLRSRLGFDLASTFLSVRTFRRLEAALPDAHLSDGGGLVEEVRKTKSPAELDCFRTAARYTEAGMRAAIEAVHEGALDNEVGAAAAGAMYAAGSEYFASGPTVTTGYRSGVAHTTFQRFRIGRGDAVLIEIGGNHRRYTSGLMRSAVIGEPDPVVVRMYGACSAALDAAIAALKPGVTAGSVHDACQAVIDRAGFEPNFRKRLGYSMGVGFAPGWGEGGFLHLSRGDSTVLRPGMVFHMPPALRMYAVAGVGCSETVAVTEDGVEVLTDFPRELATR